MYSATRSSRSSSVRRGLNNLAWFLEMIAWAFFALGVWVAVWPGFVGTYIGWQPWFTIDGLLRVMWPYAALITAVLMNFSRRYMGGNHRLGLFLLRCLLFLVSVVILSATDHLLVFIVAWGAMGWFMAGLIAHKIDWRQAREAGHLALQYFLTGTLFLSVGFIVLYVELNTLRISELLGRIQQLSPASLYVVFVSLLVASIIQSALFPVQNWLMSSMTAPTPASALMHAGFVNVGGILLTRFAAVFSQHVNLMLIIVGIGAVSAIMGKVWKMVQTAIKRQLGCSTIAQMGFMLLQCGLGYFAAAISHLMLHGFYKGYLFLSSGTAIEGTTPETKNEPSSSVARNLIGLLAGLAGGALFMGMTGKGTKFGSGLFLVFIVVLTIMHSSREVLNRLDFPSTVTLVVFPSVVLISIAVYATIFNVVTMAFHDLPIVEAPTSFTVVHGLVAVAFILLWIVLETGVLKQFNRLYVMILNASQPHPETILSSKEEYHA